MEVVALAPSNLPPHPVPSLSPVQSYPGVWKPHHLRKGPAGLQGSVESGEAPGGRWGGPVSTKLPGGLPETTPPSRASRHLMSPAGMSCSGTLQKNPGFGNLLRCVQEKQCLPLSLPTAGGQGGDRHRPLARTRVERTPVPPSLRPCDCRPLSFSPFVLGFAFSLLLLLCPAKAAKGVPHSPEPSPLPLGEASSEPARSSQETRGPARNSGEQSPSPPEPAGSPPITPGPNQTPSFWFSLRETPAPRAGGCRPASCSPWRRRSIVAGGQRAPLGGSQ